MTRSLPPSRTRGTGGCPARHGRLPTVSGRAEGAAVCLSTAAPPSVSAAESPPSRQASPPLAAPAVAAALTTFEGQAVYKIFSPGSGAFRAADVLRFAKGSRSMKARQP